MGATKKKPVAPKTPDLSVEELRAQLDGFQKEIRVEVPESAVQGAVKDIENTLLGYVKKSEIKGAWGVYKLSKTVRTRSWNRTYSSSTPAWFVVGYRPYTDEELAKEGRKLLSQKQAREKKAEKDRLAAIAKYNAAAVKLGIEPISQ